MKLVRVGVVACAVLGFGSAAAYAQEPPPDANAISDSLTVYDPIGAVFAAVSITEEDEILLGPNFINFINIPGLADPAKFGFPIVLTEPDENGLPVISDIFGVANVSGGLFLAFISDANEIPPDFAPVPPGATFLDEGLGIFDATPFLNPDLISLGYTAEFRSDPVPEPATLSLVGLGIAGLAGCRRRQRGKHGPRPIGPTGMF